MNKPTVLCDERTKAVMNESFMWTTIFLTYGLLLDVMYRGFMLKEDAWDLLGLVIASGFVGMIYQAKQKALPFALYRKMLPALLATSILAAVIAALLALWKQSPTP